MMVFQKRYEVLFRLNGKLDCISEYNSLKELESFLTEYPLPDGYTYEVIDHAA